MGVCGCCQKREDPPKTTGQAVPQYNQAKLEEPKTVYDQLKSMHLKGVDLWKIQSEEIISWIDKILEEENQKDPEKMKAMKEKKKRGVGKNIFWKYVEEITGKKKEEDEDNWQFDAYEQDKAAEQELKQKGEYEEVEAEEEER